MGSKNLLKKLGKYAAWFAVEEKEPTTRRLRGGRWRRLRR